MAEENVGVIKRLSVKGYGFIARKGRTKDLFFHVTGVSKGTIFADLREGDEVNFDGIEPTEKGESAFGVKLSTN